MSGISIAKSLELQLLGGIMTPSLVETGCHQALECHIAGVVVAPAHIEVARKCLVGSDVVVTAAIGVPWGQDLVQTKIASMMASIRLGAAAIRYVPDLTRFNREDWHAVQNEMGLLSRTISELNIAGDRGVDNVAIVIDVTTAAALEVNNAWEAIDESSIDFVQLGDFHSGITPSEDNVRRMRADLPDDVGLTVSGGVSNLGIARDILLAGAVRVSTPAATYIRSEELAEMKRATGKC